MECECTAPSTPHPHMQYSPPVFAHSLLCCGARVQKRRLKKEKSIKMPMKDKTTAGEAEEAEEAEEEDVISKIFRRRVTLKSVLVL